MSDEEDARFDAKLDASLDRESSRTLFGIYGFTALLLAPIAALALPRVLHGHAPIDRLLGPQSFGVALSPFVALAFGVAPWLVIIALTARAARKSRGPFEDEGARFEGTVRRVDGDAHGPVLRVAVRLRFDEEALAEHPTTVDAAWVEHERSVDVRPFALELASGARLRVEPDRRAHILATLGKMKSVDGTEVQERVAVVNEGDRVTVSGTGTGGVIRAPETGRLVVAVGSLRTKEARAFRRQRSQLGLAVALLFAVNASVLLPYYAALAFGRDERCAVTKATWSIRTKSGAQTVYGVDAPIPSGAGAITVRAEVPAAVYDGLNADDSLPFRVIPGARSWSYLGAANVGGGTLALLLTALVAFAGGCALRARRDREWFDRERVGG